MKREEWEQKRRVAWATKIAERIPFYAENEYDTFLTDWGIPRRRLFHLGLEMIEAAIEESLDAREWLRIYRDLLDKACYFQDAEEEEADKVKPQSDCRSLRTYSISELFAIIAALEEREVDFDLVTSQRFKENEEKEYEENPNAV